jgi:L-asparaginase
VEVSSLPHITILATGGTIAGCGESPDQGAYTSATLHVDELIASVPSLGELAQIEGEQVAQVGSQDVSSEHWLKLARRARACLAHEDNAGVVVTHGTDTLEETAFFLDQVLPADKAIVITGAMRPASGLSADGPRNILDSVRVAVHPEARGRGVLVVLDEIIHSARGVTKTNTARVSTFQSPDIGTAGAIVAGRTIFHRKAAPRAERSLPDLEGLSSLPRVDIVNACAGAQPDIVQACLDLGAQGLVLAGVGNGNASKEMVAALAEAVSAGVPVVRSTRAGSGFVARNLEIDDDGLGFVAAGPLNPAKARVLLQLVLLDTTDTALVQERFFSI